MSSPLAERPTLRMVAKEAGVSVATVSYVLSGRHRSHTIKDSTADRVREAASRLGYRRNDAARAIRTGKSDLVLLSLNVLADPWSQAVVLVAGNKAGDCRRAGSDRGLGQRLSPGGGTQAAAADSTAGR